MIVLKTIIFDTIKSIKYLGQISFFDDFCHNAGIVVFCIESCIKFKLFFGVIIYMNKTIWRNVIMPALKTYDLFISHVWRNEENSEYYRLVNLLREASFFTYRNYSVPEHNPLGTKTDKELREALDRQIKPVNCVLVVSGMYTNYRRWIQEEIEIAKKYNKPIIGIKPWGQQRVPQEIQNIAKEMVGWQTSSIVAAIRKHSL